MIPRSSRPFQSLWAGSARGVSRSVLSALTVGAPLLLLAQSLTSCGSDDDGDGACPAGEVRACIVTGNSCEASQTCATDGSGYSVCACNDGSGAGGSAGAAGSGGGANAGAAGAAGAGPTPDAPLFPPNVGAVGSPCDTDADCPVGPGGETPLTCVTSSSTAFAGGGPEGGYCTLPCTESDQCAAVDGPSFCGLQDEAGNGGYCFRLCVPGPDGTKCPSLGSACLPVEDGIGVCTPVCGSDFACGDGLFCNLAPEGMAVCSATERSGGETGAACTEATADVDCKSGFCISPGGDPAEAFCTTYCTLGLSDACGFNEGAGLPRDAVCALAPSVNADLGDLGLCIELCDVAGDCEQAGWICEDLPADIQPEFGRQGRCVPPGGADAGVVGGADAGG